jgi:hypothetical protein
MALPLTREMLEQAYEYLCVTPPFRGWNLPHGEDIKFRVIRSKDFCGYHEVAKGTHIIAISTRCIGRTDSLMVTMAHEMIHTHQWITSMETTGVVHNTAFKKLAARVCAIHGFDPKLF